MASSFERVIAEILRDGRPDVAGVVGFQSLYGWELFDFATVSSRHIFIGQEPKDPDDCVTVIPEAGGPPLRRFSRQLGWTVRVRAASYEDVRTFGEQVNEILQDLESSLRKVGIFRVQATFEPTILGRDGGDRGGRYLSTQSFGAVSRTFARFTP